MTSLARTLCLTHTANAISVGVVGGMESSLAQNVKHRVLHLSPDMYEGAKEDWQRGLEMANG